MCRVNSQGMLRDEIPDCESHVSLDQLNQSDNPISVIDQSHVRAQTRLLPVLKPGYIYPQHKFLSDVCCSG